MAVNWNEFDKAVDSEQLQKDISEGRNSDFPEIPKGSYEVQFDKIELGLTKNDNRPMLKVSAKILKGKFKGQHLFMNRVIYGTKNDGRMIASTEGWLAKLEAEDEDGELISTKFKTYKQFAGMIDDIAEALEELELTYRVDYDSNAFNSISVKEILED